MQLTTLVSPLLIPLFNEYYKDAMLADDILELIKVFADVPENPPFDQLVMPHVYSQI